MRLAWKARSSTACPRRRYFVRLDQTAPAQDFWVRVERGRVTRVENTSGTTVLRP
jgi:hypothetical protein